VIASALIRLGRVPATLRIPNRHAPSIELRRFVVCIPSKRHALMKIAVPCETAAGETRVALTPLIAGQHVSDGADVLVQSCAGNGKDQ